ncbi:hypothetical protein V8E36_003084 [Tilletia maclaganii]
MPQPQPLSEETWNQIQQSFGHTIRSWQKNGLQRFFRCRDLLLIAPTGAGKSMLFRILVVAWPELIWVVIVPLKDLEREQADKLAGNAVYINGDNKSKALFEKVRKGGAKVVLVSPEMALSNDFRALFEHDSFRGKLGGFVLDEGHSAIDWGDTFRKNMGELNRLRHRADVPAMVLSGTMPEAYRRRIRSIFELRSLDVLDLGCNRPNLCISIFKMQHPSASYLDILRFLPELWPQPAGGMAKATPTLIYLNNKDEIQSMWRTLRLWYERAGLGGKVTTYTAEYSDSHKEELRGLIERGELVCVIATDALGMGADIAAILRVIQWGIAKESSPAAVLQRLGRAGRRPTERAEGVILAEPWVVGGGARDAKHRDQVDDDLFSITAGAIDGSKDCIRERFNKLMENPKKPPYPSEELFGVPPGTFDDLPCCGTCAAVPEPGLPPELLPLPPPKPDPLPQSAAIALDVKAKLLAWRTEKATGDFRARLARSPLGLAALLRDEDIADLVSNIGKVAHGLKPDSPAVFQLRNFVRSRFATEILSDVRGVIEGVLAEFRARAQASLQAAQQTREAAAAQRARQKDEREQAKFWQECQRKKTEAQAENCEPRQCGGCRKWLEQHPGWNEQNPSQYVEPYGHYSNAGRCFAKRLEKGMSTRGTWTDSSTGGGQSSGAVGGTGSATAEPSTSAST